MHWGKGRIRPSKTTPGLVRTPLPPSGDASADAWAGAGASNCSMVGHRLVRDPILSSPVLAPGHPLSPVPMRVMSASAVCMPAAYQAAKDHLCLSSSIFPLVQDFARITSFIVLLAGQAAEPLCPSALYPDVPFP